MNKDYLQNSVRNIESNNMECNSCSESGGATTTSVSSRSKDEAKQPVDQIFGSFSSQIVDLQG